MNGFKTAILLTLMMVVFLLIGYGIGGRSGMTVAFIFSLAMNFGTYWFSDKIVLMQYKAKPVTREEAPKFYEMVEKLAQNANIPMPKVYIIDDPSPNAFATGRNPQNASVAATTGILAKLNNEEMAGVMAHELAHVKNRDILIGTIAASIAGSITFIATMARWTMIFGGRDDEDEGGGLISSLLLIVLAPIAAMILQMSISRSREYLADEGGSKISGNPKALASALAKISNTEIPVHDAGPATAHMFIVNPFSGKAKGFMNLFSTHPPVEERIARLLQIAEGRL